MRVTILTNWFIVRQRLIRRKVFSLGADVGKSLETRRKTTSCGMLAIVGFNCRPLWCRIVGACEIRIMPVVCAPFTPLIADIRSLH